jgi:hypothetical protein
MQETAAAIAKATSNLKCMAQFDQLHIALSGVIADRYRCLVGSAAKQECMPLVHAEQQQTLKRTRTLAEVAIKLAPLDTNII